MLLTDHSDAIKLRPSSFFFRLASNAFSDIGSLLFFFLENAKNLGRSDDAKRRKKRGWPCAWLYFLARKFNISIQLFLKISPSDVMVM